MGSDRDCVDVGGAGRFTFGTPGWTLALEILAAGQEEWRHHLASLREQTTRQIRILTEVLGKAAASESES